LLENRGERLPARFAFQRDELLKLKRRGQGECKLLERLLAVRGRQFDRLDLPFLLFLRIAAPAAAIFQRTFEPRLCYSLPRPKKPFPIIY
jgi:hypothetical protein